MKLLRLIVFNPHYFVIFFVIAILYCIELIIEVVSFPFRITQEGIEYLIKKLLNIVK